MPTNRRTVIELGFKYPIEDSVCLLWTVAALMNLPDDVFDVVVAEVKTRTCDEKHYYFKHSSNFLFKLVSK